MTSRGRGGAVLIVALVAAGLVTEPVGILVPAVLTALGVRFFWSSIFTLPGLPWVTVASLATPLPV